MIKTTFSLTALLFVMSGAAPGAPIDLPRTGQTNCYAENGLVIDCAGTGQDGDTLAGVAWPGTRFTNNGDQTVTDNLTGLMWLQDGRCLTPTNQNFPPWLTAFTRVADLNAGARFCPLQTVLPGAPYDDWRVPNIIELSSLINAAEGKVEDWLNTQGFFNVLSGYWSSDTFPYAALSARAWAMTFSGTWSQTIDKSSGAAVWAVRTAFPAKAVWRTGQKACYSNLLDGFDPVVIDCADTGQDGEIQAGVTWPAPRFTDRGDGTVTDNLTGLIWLKDANCIETSYLAFDTDGNADGQVTWQHALDFVAGINDGSYPDCSAGQSDWRLPNRIESISLFDFSAPDPVHEVSSSFSNIENFYWSSTTDVAAPQDAWHAFSGSGGWSTDAKTNVHYVWPVRTGDVQQFSDVPPDYWAFAFIETLAASGITAGCGNNNYCPLSPVSRAQMAVFLERGINGSGFVPPPATGNVFLDVGAGDFAANFIEQFFADGITAGCGNMNYCPDGEVTRDQMAVFLLRSKYGAGYSPPPPSGVFDDVPLNYWAVAWIEQLAAEGITSGCGNNNYCPTATVNRDQMAVFLVRTFGL